LLLSFSVLGKVAPLTVRPSGALRFHDRLAFGSRFSAHSPKQQLLLRADRASSSGNWPPSPEPTVIPQAGTCQRALFLSSIAPTLTEFYGNFCRRLFSIVHYPRVLASQSSPPLFPVLFAFSLFQRTFNFSPPSHTTTQGRTGWKAYRFFLSLF